MSDSASVAFCWHVWCSINLHITIIIIISIKSGILVLTVLMHAGMARLSWPGWLVKYQDGMHGHPSQY